MNKRIRYLHNRVRGFTIIEVIIGMILTAFIVIFALSAIRYYNGYFYKMTAFEKKQREISLLQIALTNDFLKSDKVLNDNNLLCQGDISSVIYVFNDDKIIRSTETKTDTFFIKHSVPVLINSTQSNDLISQISIDCFINDLIIPVSVYKKYPLGLTFEKLK